MKRFRFPFLFCFGKTGCESQRLSVPGTGR